MLRSDVKSDRSVNSLDLALITALITERGGADTIGRYDKADITGDGRITALDTAAARAMCSKRGCTLPSDDLP